VNHVLYEKTSTNYSWSHFKWGTPVKMKVFISSVISGYEEYRDIAAAASRSLGHEVIRAEDFGSSPDYPQSTCLGGVWEADVVVLLLGGSYGAVQSSGFSATHEEYVEARSRCPVIVLVEEGVTREENQEAFVADVQNWAEGHYTEGFANIDSLRDAIIGSLHRIELARATGPVHSNEMLQRAIDLLPSDRQNIGTVLTVVVSGGPLQSVLRPAELEDKELSQRLHKEALFGQVPVLDAKQGTDTLIVGDSTSLDLVILLTIRAYQFSRNNQKVLSVRPKSEVHDTKKRRPSNRRPPQKLLLKRSAIFSCTLPS